MKCCLRRFGSYESRLLASLIFVAFCPTLAVGPLLGAEDDLRARLERLPQPWKEKVHRVTQEE